MSDEVDRIMQWLNETLAKAERPLVDGVRPLDRRQLVVVRGAIDVAVRLGRRSEAEVLQMFVDGEISEGFAAFWLGVDRLELREKVASLRVGKGASLRVGEDASEEGGDDK